MLIDDCPEILALPSGTVPDHARSLSFSPGWVVPTISISLHTLSELESGPRQRRDIWLVNLSFQMRTKNIE